MTLIITFMIVLLVQAIPHSFGVDEGRPYETWDEIATYNNAHVVVTPAADSTFRYGSIDTFLQWVAIVGYDYLATTGANYAHIRYSNNFPASWNDPLLSFRKKTWAAGLNYAYFRGTDDRSAIFVSRRLHLVFAYFVIAAIGVAAISIFNARAVYVLLPLLLLSLAPETYYQTALSLPNAINAFVAFAVVFFAMLFAHSGRIGYLLISAACLAIGLNCKPDIIAMGSAIGLALCLFVLKGKIKFAVISGAKAALFGGIVFIATDPIFLANPLFYTRATYHALRDPLTAAASISNNIVANPQTLNDFLSASLFWNGAGLGLPFAMIVILIFLGTAAVKRTQPHLTVAIGAAIALVTLGALVLKVGPNYLPERYFLNGFAAFLATLSMAMILAESGKWRLPARIALAVVLVSYCGHAAERAAHSLAMHFSYRKAGGFDPSVHQTQASLLAIATAKQPGYSPIILVDQHAYIDLLPFREAAIDAKYINLGNLDAVVASLPRGCKYLIVFGRGDYGSHETADERFFEGGWNQELRDAYDSYQTSLMNLPILRRYPGARPSLLAIGPVNPDADITLAVLSIP